MLFTQFVQAGLSREALSMVSVKEANCLAAIKLQVVMILLRQYHTDMAII